MTVRKIASATVTMAQRRCGGGNPSCVLSPCCVNDKFQYSAVLRTYAESQPSVDAVPRQTCPSAPMLGEEGEQRAVENVGPFPIQRMTGLGHAHDLRARDVR